MLPEIRQMFKLGASVMRKCEAQQMWFVGIRQNFEPANSLTAGTAGRAATALKLGDCGSRSSAAEAL